MKSILFLILFFLSSVSVFAEEEIPNLVDYAGYTNSVESYCKLKGNIPNKSDLWMDWERGSLIKTEQVKYADIAKKEAISDTEYKKYLEKIKSDASRIDIL